MQAGWSVVGIDNQPLEAPVSRSHFQFHKIDITSAEETQSLAKTVRSMKCGITVLINNAGIADPYMPEGPADRMSHWNKVISTNLTGAQRYTTDMHTDFEGPDVKL